jgi:hypothetical protein
MDALMFVGKVIKQGDLLKKCAHMWGESKKNVECFHCGRKLEMTLTLVDFKTSNSVDKTAYAQQLSAYQHALKELTKMTAKQLFVVRIDKQRAKYEVVRVVDPKKAFKAFMNCSQIYDWIHDGVTKLYPVEEKEVIKI